jgi:hypothetical protein
VRPMVIHDNWGERTRFEVAKTGRPPTQWDVEPEEFWEGMDNYKLSADRDPAPALEIVWCAFDPTWISVVWTKEGREDWARLRRYAAWAPA